MDGPRYKRDRALLIGAGLAALLALACPHPAPTPSKPDASDAAPAPAPVSCDSACKNAVKVCSTVVLSVCGDNCNRIGYSFAVKLLAATGCPDVAAAGR